MWMEQQEKEEGWSGKRKETTVGQRLDALKGRLLAKKVQLPPVIQEGDWPQEVVEPHGVFVPCCPLHRHILDPPPEDKPGRSVNLDEWKTSDDLLECWRSWINEKIEEDKQERVKNGFW